MPAGFFFASIQLASPEKPNLIERPNADSGPTQVSVAIWIVDINSIDSAQQSFIADVFTVLRWRDARLAHTGTGVAHYALDQIWNPRVVIVNETNSVSHRLPESVEVDADGTVAYRQRFVGSFTQALVLKSFPFDKQTFHVQLAAVKYSPNEVDFVADQKWVDAGIKQAAGIANSITLPDWTVGKWDVNQLPRLPYMTRLDAFILTSTLLVFFSLIEVLVTTILDNNQQTERAKKIDRYCRAIFPIIFAIASVAIFAKPRD